jgi:hypothetical protein
MPAGVPASFPGSLPEYLCFITLLSLRKRVGVDFIFQSSILGGRTEKGGLIIDFQFINPPDLAINIQGEYFHYRQGRAVVANDILTREILAGEGIKLIFIDAEDIGRDRFFYVLEALNYKDHSQLGR